MQKSLTIVHLVVIMFMTHTNRTGDFVSLNTNQLYSNKPSTFGISVDAEVKVFKTYCIGLFGEINGTYIYEFYKKAMLPIPGSGKSQASKQRKHLESLLALAHNDHVIILEAMSQLSDKFNTSTIPERFSQNYVTGAIRLRASGEIKYKKIEAYSKPKTVNKKAAAKEVAESTITNKIAPQHITPTRNNIVRADAQDEIRQYDYKCSCGTIIKCLVDKCPVCSNTFDWMPHVK